MADLCFHRTGLTETKQNLIMKFITEQNRFPKLLSDYKLRGRRNQGRQCKKGRTSFECHNYQFKPKSWNRPLEELKL